MQVQVNQLSPVLVEFDVEIAAERVALELEKAFSLLSKSAKVKGFRPGKAPRAIINQVFGARVAADVAQRLVDETFPRAVSEKNVQPITTPAFEPQRLVKDQPFLYKVRFEVIPQISEVNYSGLEAKRPLLKVEEQAVDEAVDRLRREHSTLEVPKEARPAKDGDVVTIDFVVTAGGREVKDAGAQDFQVELGSGSLIKEIEQGLLGKEVASQVNIDVLLSEQHPHPKLRGKTATFQVTVKDIKERVLPTADDEFAKDVGAFETLFDLKKSLRERLEVQLKEQSDTSVAEQLVQALANANSVPVPPSLVERQSQLTEQEILNRARSEGQQASRVGPELRAQIQADSEMKVRAGLLMAEIAKKESIKIGDAEFEEGLTELATQTGKNLAKLRVEYRDARKREMLLGMILENKVLDIIEQKAKIVDE